jgi:uncharacterized protein YecA (UPF0149 family)
MAKRRDDHTTRFDKKRERDEAHQKQLPTEEEPELPPPVDTIRSEEPRTGRNDPCPCGSGKKYKKCCGKGK